MMTATSRPGLQRAAFALCFMGAVWGGRDAGAQALECHNEYMDVPGGGVAVPVCEYPPKNQRPRAEEPDVWGAIAVSASTLNWGSTWNADSKQLAATGALKSCGSAANRPKDCKVVVTFPDICAALAMSTPERLFSVGGPTGATDYAEGNALLKCQRAGGRSCAVVTRFCADGKAHVVGPRPAAPFGRIPRQ